ncbi:hypothetical protein [Laspinema palackyanum]
MSKNVTQGWRLMGIASFLGGDRAIASFLLFSEIKQTETNWMRY